MNYRNVALIPARGGSKRIPGKNIKEFCGEPIIAYSIKHAQECELFQKVIVSTESKEIAEVAEHYGAEVPFMRPTKLADDYTGTNAVIIHALKWLQENDHTYDYACCIYPTAPLATKTLLIKGFELLIKNEATSVFSVTTYPSAIFRSLKINERNRLELIWPEHKKSRSQDLTEAYHDAGQFYWIDIKKYLKEREILSKDSMPLVIPRHYVIDVDTKEDWIFAEFLFETIKKVNNNDKKL